MQLPLQYFPTIITQIDGLTAWANLGARTRYTHGFGKVKTRKLQAYISTQKSRALKANHTFFSEPTVVDSNVSKMMRC